MLLKTHTAHAPWTIVEANDKKYARLKTLKTLVKTIEKEL
jgi:polyphosphate kinase 2 (PPK2 family)